MGIPMMQRTGYAARTLIAAAVACSTAPALADFRCPVRPSEYLGVDGGGFLVMIGGKHVKVADFKLIPETHVLISERHGTAT